MPGILPTNVSPEGALGTLGNSNLGPTLTHNICNNGTRKSNSYKSEFYSGNTCKNKK